MAATALLYPYYTSIIGAQSFERAERGNKCEWQRLEEEERGVCGNVEGGQEGRQDDQERGKVAQKRFSKVSVKFQLSFSNVSVKVKPFLG